MRVRHAAVMAGLALGLMSGSAKAAIYTEYLDYSFVNESFTDTAYSPGYDLITFQDQITNLGASTNLGTIPTSLRLDGHETTYSSATHAFVFGASKATRLGDKYSVYEDVKIGEPVPVGYVPDGTIPVLDIGYVAQGETVKYKVSYVVSDDIADLNVKFDIVSSVPLPGSASMFGAAILVLGTVGYGVKRKKAAPAA